jgi:serine phosphatase RsbU (regulator of sigma subunit)
VDGLAEAVIVCSAEGVAQLVNTAGKLLLPEVTVGTELTSGPITPLHRAVLAGVGAFDGEYLGRRLRGLRRRLTDGRYIWYIRDHTEETNRTMALLAERSRSAFLAEVSNELSRSLHRARTMDAVVTLPVPFLADCVAVVLRPFAGLSRWARYAVGNPEPVDDWVPAGELGAVPGLPEALAGEDGETSPWLTTELADLGWLLPEDFGPPSTALVVAMPSPGGPAGALVAVRGNLRPNFDHREIALVRQYAARAGAALGLATLHSEQARMAQVLQTSLLPPQLPEIKGALMAAGYRPAREKLRIGGDFYDAFPTGDGGTFALGDVCGKGLEAAVLSGRVRQSVHSLRMVTERPLHLIDLLNKALMTTPYAASRSQFTTLLLGTFTPRPNGDLDITIAGGGHPDPLVVRATAVETLRVGGMPVGALTEARFNEVTLRLAPGDLLLAYSDGVTEARGGPSGKELLGEARLRRAVAGWAGLSPGELVERLLRLVGDWLDGQDHDDIALLALHAPPTAA